MAAGLKRRAQRIAGGVTRDFRYAGNQILVEEEGGSVVVEYMSAGSIGQALSLIFRDAGGVKETYHFDSFDFAQDRWIGSARALTNAAQTVIATWNYEAFGSVVGSTGSSANPYRYDGKWRYRDDGDFGLLHVGARYYEPAVGRWVSRDPLLGNPASPQSVNPYVYVLNNPVGAYDRDGHAPWWWPAAAVVVGVGAIACAFLCPAAIVGATVISTVVVADVMLVGGFISIVAGVIGTVHNWLTGGEPAPPAPPPGPGFVATVQNLWHQLMHGLGAE